MVANIISLLTTIINLIISLIKLKSVEGIEKRESNSLSFLLR